MQASAVLDRVLERTGLCVPDSDRPLWRYPTTSEDLGALRRDFAARGAVPRHLDRRQQGALTLLAAHILCEQLGAGAWKWDPVFETLGWGRGQIEEQRLREHIGDGLELYWKRAVRVVAGDREYLGSLLLEGGLPLAWLKGESDGGVQQFLQRLIRLVERYAVAGAELADENIELLPVIAREQPTVRQLAEMADVLVELRRLLPSGCESPADFLTASVPDWRARLPLPQARLDQADGIVGQLLATESGVEQGPPILALDWRLASETGRLERSVLLSDRITVDALATEIDAPAEVLPALLYLSLESSRGRRLQLARLERRGDGTTYVMVPTGPLPRLGGLDEWRAVITALGHEHGSFMPVGGEALELDLPWVFDDRPVGNHVLLAVGSCESRHQAFLVSLPAANPAPVPDGPDSGVFRLQEPRAEDRTYYRVVGSAQVSVGDEAFRFVGGGNLSTAAVKLRAQGPRLWLGTLGTTPFLGPPRVSALDGDRPLAVPAAQLEWRAADGSGRWRGWAHEPAGEITVRWRRDSVTVARIRVTVVPRDFQIATVGSGRDVAVEVSARALRSLEIAAGYPARVDAGESGTYRIRATQERPHAAELPARLWFACGVAASVRLPIPSAVTGFVGPDGRWLPAGAKLSFARTDALRARGAGHRRFQLDARIPGESPWEPVASISADASGWAELSLDAVRAQLEPLLCSTDLDRTLELQFLPGSHMQAGACKLQLAHYGLEVQYEPDRDADGVLRGFDLHVVPAGGQTLDDEEVRGLTLRLLPLIAPWKLWLDVQRHDDNRFRLNAQGIAPGPYLVLAFDGELMRSRPKLLHVPGEVDAGASAIAATATMPSFTDRNEAWHVLVAEMIRDFEHPVWVEFQRLVELTDKVPAPSFELLRTVADSAEAVSVCILRQLSPDHQRMLLRALSQLGVMPQCLPLRAWIRGMRLFVASIERTESLVAAFGGAAPALAAVAKGAFGETGSPVAMLELLRCIGHRAGLAVPAPSEAHLARDSGMLTAVLGAFWQRVLVRHAQDDRWPRANFHDAAFDAAGELDLPECITYQGDVLRAPAVAAASSFYGIPMQEAHIRRMRQLQLFEPDWFEMAHVICLTLLAKRHPDAVERYVHDI